MHSTTKKPHKKTPTTVHHKFNSVSSHHTTKSSKPYIVFIFLHFSIFFLSFFFCLIVVVVVLFLSFFFSFEKGRVSALSSLPTKSCETHSVNRCCGKLIICWHDQQKFLCRSCYFVVVQVNRMLFPWCAQ